jgi:hypothetical protein
MDPTLDFGQEHYPLRIIEQQAAFNNLLAE